MTGVAVITFSKFMALVNIGHTRFQIYAVEDPTKFRLFVFYQDLVYFCRVEKKTLFEEGDSGESKEFKLNMFRQTYLKDAIYVEDMLLPDNIKTFDYTTEQEDIPKPADLPEVYTPVKLPQDFWGHTKG